MELHNTGVSDTDMKFQLIQIGNSLVPAIYPQTWDEDLQDWIVTSDTNPLPVGNMDFNDFKQILTDIEQGNNEALDTLSQAVSVFRSLIENSVPKEGENN